MLLQQQRRHAAAIWKHFEQRLVPEERELDLDRAELRGALRGLLPAYSLFQADRRNTDGDSEAQDPMRAAVKVILQDEELKKTLDAAARTVRERLQTVSGGTLDVLKGMDPDAARGLKADLPDADSLCWADVFKRLTITDSDGIPLNERGSGIRRLVLISFFRACRRYHLRLGRTGDLAAQRQAHQTGGGAQKALAEDRRAGAADHAQRHRGEAALSGGSAADPRSRLQEGRGIRRIVPWRKAS